MARITVEDCLEQIPNRFQLVLAATYRARMLSQGHTPKIEARNKPAVTALREHPVIQESWAVAREWSDAAVAALAPLPEGIVKSALASFAEAVVSRDV